MQKSLIVVAVIILLAAPARGEPVNRPPPENPAQIQSASVLTTEKSRVELPPLWWILPPDSYQSIDDELKRLQLEELRLTAENESLRNSAGRHDVSWIAMAIVAIVSAGTGAYAWSRR